MPISQNLQVRLGFSFRCRGCGIEFSAQPSPHIKLNDSKIPKFRTVVLCPNCSSYDLELL
jgi:hypothetical protein